MIVRTYEQAMKVCISLALLFFHHSLLFSIRLLARNKITKTIRLQATQLDKVVVATDDERIAKVCR